MHRVLLVEDDATVREIVTMVLDRAGFATTAVADGQSALDTASSQSFDVVVLDLMLPGVNGFDVCRRLRADTKVPIVMLTARADSADVVAGLELGADDYVTKPFDPTILTARIRAVLRRASGQAGGELATRGIRVDERAFRAFKGSDEMNLTTIELRLLAELVRHVGDTLSREALLSSVWGYDYLGDSRLVDMAVKRLRDKLGDSESQPPYISTVRGVGYRFESG